MKKAILMGALMLTGMSAAFSAITIRYYNKDSKKHTMKVSIDGSSKEVSFDSSTTGSVTIQGGGKTCFIETKCGKIEIKDGANIEIKDGCITVK